MTPPLIEAITALRAHMHNLHQFQQILLHEDRLCNPIFNKGHFRLGIWAVGDRPPIAALTAPSIREPILAKTASAHHLLAGRQSHTARVANIRARRADLERAGQAAMAVIMNSPGAKQLGMGLMLRAWASANDARIDIRAFCPQQPPHDTALLGPIPEAHPSALNRVCGWLARGATPKDAATWIGTWRAPFGNIAYSCSAQAADFEEACCKLALVGSFAILGSDGHVAQKA